MTNDAIDMGENEKINNVLTYSLKWKREQILKKIKQDKKQSLKTVSQDNEILILEEPDFDKNDWVTTILEILNEKKIDMFSLNDLIDIQDEILDRYIEKIDVSDKITKSLQLLSYKNIIKIDKDGNFKKQSLIPSYNNTEPNVQLDNMQMHKRYHCPKSYIESVNNNDDIEKRINNLADCDKIVFKLLNTIDGDSFCLEDVYKFENEFKKFYPNNNRVKNKLRQRLQYLRDINLVEFVSPGKYKKLW